MWNSTARAEHSRAGLRYRSDLTDTEWRLIEPYLPPPRRHGRRRRWSMRHVVEAIFYVLRSGCPWHLLPDSFPPWRTVYRCFSELRDALVFESLNHHLVQLDRARVGREPCPSAAVIDSQSVKTTEAGGPRGFDAGKRVMGRKRHAMVDTDGRALRLLVHAAAVQDRDGAVPLLKQSRHRHPLVERAFADSAYNNPRVADVTSNTIEIVHKFADQTGFVVHPRRWVVERTFPWINRNRRLAKDFEQSDRQLPSSTPQPLWSSSDGPLVTHEIQDGLSVWTMKEVTNARRKHTPDEIIGKLREVAIVLAQGGTTAEACRRIAVTEQTFGSRHAPAWLRCLSIAGAKNMAV